jgi:Tol biopolymer transport system component
MNRFKPQISFLILLAAILFSLTGCIFTGSRARLPDQILNSPDDLPENLGVLQVFLTRNQDNQVSGILTTLDRNIQSDINLEKNGRELKVSEDKTKAVYSKVETIDEEFRSSIWLLDLNDGTKSQVIVWPEILTDSSIADPNFFPGMEKLIFSIAWNNDNTIGLGSIGLDGGNYQVIDTPRNTFSEGPVVSPDGEKILVLCEGIDKDSGKPGFMLCIMNNDGSGRIRLTNDGNYHGTYLFTSDNKSIIFSEAEWGGLLGIIDKPRYEIKRIDIDGKNQQTILEWHRAVNVLALSDEGTEIVFMDRPEGAKPPKLYLIDVDGQNLRHLAYFDQFLAEWYGEN